MKEKKHTSERAILEKAGESGQPALCGAPTMVKCCFEPEDFKGLPIPSVDDSSKAFKHVVENFF